MKKLTKKRSIADKIHPVGEIERCLAMLVYGPQKTGKTVFACTFPKPLLLIDIKERGEDSVVDVDGVDVLHMDTWAEFEDVYWYLKEGTKYKSVVLDQLTGLQGLVIAELKEKKGQKPGDVFSQRSYGQLSGQMNTWLLNYRDLIGNGYHVCFLAHEKRTGPAEEDDEERLNPEVMAALTGSIVNFVNGAVSVIGNQFIREHYDRKTKESTKEFCMRIGPHAFYRAGMRRPVSAGPVPDVIVDPSFDKILKLSKGESLARKVKRKL